MLGQLPLIALIVTAASTYGAIYDRAITVFSPDGKLMQVSYAEQAVERGALAVAATNGRETIVLCVERPAGGNGADNSEDAKKGANLADAEEVVKSSDRRHRGRRRDRHRGPSGSGSGGITGIVDHANNQDRKLCEVDDGVYLAFAGISADGRALTSKIRLECQNYRYGMGEAPSIGYIARYVGGLQHRFTRTGGARPFGVSCLIAGFDEEGTPRLFRSEPSGAFAEWKASAVGKGADKALGRLESVSDLGSLSWRETAETAVRATLAGGDGGTRSCDVLLLRHRAPGTDAIEISDGKGPGVEDDDLLQAGGYGGNRGALLTGERGAAGIFVSRLVGRLTEADGPISWTVAAKDEDEEPSFLMTGVRGNN